MIFVIHQIFYKMKIIINSNEKTIEILEPIKISDLLKELNGIKDIKDYSILPKIIEYIPYYPYVTYYPQFQQYEMPELTFTTSENRNLMTIDCNN